MWPNMSNFSISLLDEFIVVQDEDMSDSDWHNEHIAVCLPPLHEQLMWLVPTAQPRNHTQQGQAKWT